MTKTFEELFTEEEKQIVDTCLKFGNITEAPILLDAHAHMTVERELALEDYVNKHKTVSISDSDSEVRAEMEMKVAKGELIIDTPEVEAEWQAKIDAEREAKEAKSRGNVLSVEEFSKQEIMDKLKELGIDFKPAQPKSELLDLLEAQN